MKKIAFILLILLSLAARSNPVVRGTWVGYILSGTDKLPTTLYITDDNENGKIYGEIVIAFTFRDGKQYFCKARFSGNVDYKSYDFAMVMEEYIYYDLLPEGKKWCLGTFYGSIRREMELKQYIIQSTMKTKCSETDSQMILVKQQ